MATLRFTHRWIPAQDTRSTATLLLLHGTGGNEDDLVGLGEVIAPGIAKLSPRGQVLEHGMPRFFRRLAEGVFDLDDLRTRTAELAAFVREASQAYGFDPAQVYAAGFSNGANIAASLLLLSPETLAGGVLLRAMIPLVPETLPDLTGKHVLLSEGRHDPIVPVTQAEGLETLLRQAHANVALHWQEASHNLIQADVDDARAFFARVLG